MAGRPANGGGSNDGLAHRRGRVRSGPRPEVAIAVAGAVDDVLAALANPTRRRIVDLLLEHGRLPVRELAAEFDMARPSVSEHLRVLREAGLVTERKRGRERLYRLSPESFETLGEWLRRYEAFWRTRLGKLRILLDEEDDA